MNARAQRTQEVILNAVERILVRDGGDSVTIAAVAREAQVSKGGLFHHFASKELLIEGVINRYVAAFDELLLSAGDARGAATFAYLDSVARSAGPAARPVVALLAASMVSSKAVEVLRDRYEKWQKRLDEDGLPPGVASVVRFAVDGLWLADTLDLAPATGERRGRVIELLREQVTGAL